ncbi:MAG: major facilitator superfamily 1 [Verrucomicrobiales bacterium]|nr:major facilitator superfamily 1 [Verrucomicrobiales bacterium]
MSQPSPLPTSGRDSQPHGVNPPAKNRSFLSAFARFFLTGPDAAQLTDEAEIKHRYKKNRISVMLSITLGYAMYYVVRQGFAVVKKPLLEAKIFDAAQIGAIGSVFFMTYMIGKCVNGFLADRLNIKRFLALGLLGSSSILVGIGFCSEFYLFAVLWGLCGWFQTFGSAPCVVSLNQWFSNKERGTLYGVWFSAHNIGTGLTYIITAYIIKTWGWRMGFYAPGVLGVSASFFLYLFMRDRPQVYGLPPVAVYAGELTPEELKAKDKPVFKAQLRVLLRPAVWILGLSSAACYITRYAFESWGVVFLTEAKGYTLTQASAIISISQFAGIAGAITCGLISDKLFNHKRNIPCLLFGVFFVLSTATFVYVPKGNPWSDYVSMAFFGYTVYALVSYLGGLMAVDICSRKATGAVMGVIGLFSYAGASLQEAVGGYLLNAHKTIGVDGKTIYDFTTVSKFWVVAAVFALVLPLFVWNAKHED